MKNKDRRINIFRDLPLGWKFSFVVCGVVVMMGIASILLIESRLNNVLHAEHEQRAMTIVRNLAVDCVDLILTDNRLKLHQLLLNIKATEKDVEYIFVLDSGKNIFAHTFGEKGFPKVLIDLNPLQAGAQSSYAHLEFEADGKRIDDLAVLVMDGAAEEIHLGLTHSFIQQKIIDLRQELVGITTLVCLLGAITALFFARIINNPLKSLAIASDKVGQGELIHDLPIVAHDEIGRLTATFNQMIRNIKESKAKQEKAEEDRIRLAAAIDQSSETVLITDIEGNIQYVNPAFEKISGYTSEEAIGQHVSFLGSDKQDKAFFNKMWSTLRQGEAWSGHLSNKKKDGSIFEEEAAISPVKNSEGQITNFVAVKRDVSREILLEKQLHRSEKMEAIGIMAGGVAHDLNNILSGIISYPELLLLDLPGDSPLRKPLETIRSSALRAADVVADLLTIARGAAAPKKVCDLNKLLQEYLESAEVKRPLETQPGITLHTDLSPDLFTINCSAIHIRKCVLNLFINACEAIDKVGTVTISTRNRYIDKPLKGYEEVQRGEYVVLSVVDTGSGISSADREHIFEPFYSKKVIGRSGTGLGLAVVWSAVQDHNSYINVSSNDQGTCFDLYFPASRELVDDGKDHLTSQDLQGKGQSVLVIDDEAVQRDIATSLLNRLGYQPSSAASGEEAVSFLKTHKVDLLILDMIMGQGANGRKTYEQIISLHPGQKAIIVSGFSETDEVKKTLNLGAGIFIKKPYTINQLGYAVKQELET